MRATSSCWSFPSTFWSDSAIGVDEMLDRLLALLQLVGLAFLELLELRLGEFQEGLVVRRERVCGERLQRGAE